LIIIINFLFSQVPGVEYPDILTVVTIGDSVSVEPCCGTHCANTRDLLDFCITSEKSAGGSGLRSLRAITGEAAKEAFSAAEDLTQEVEQLENRAQGVDYDSVAIHSAIKALRRSIDETEIPFISRRDLLKRIATVDKQVRKFLSCFIIL
jgi:alanyl-tRNA synthetase